jgi:CBS domain-containing protein
VVTDTDLMDVERRSPFALKSAIERAADREGVVRHVRELPEVVVTLIEASADPVDVGRVVAFVIDAATKRLIELATAELGEPPGAISWLAFGSAARHEQALHTDQDHALAFEGGPEMGAYAERLAEFVTSGLEAAGIPRCEGNAMATNPMLRRDVAGLVDQFRTWMRDLGSQGSERLSIVLDYRRVTGSVPIDDALDELIRSAPNDPAFVRHLKRRALDLKPPTGFVRDFVVEAHGEHAGRLDIKHLGIVIVGNLARGWAIGAGLTATGTLERLSAAAAAGVIDDDLREELAETFRFLWEIRLRHQVEQHLAGRTPDDFIDPAELGPITRRSLKEAFRVIARAQKALSADLGVSVR